MTGVAREGADVLVHALEVRGHGLLQAEGLVASLARERTLFQVDDLGNRWTRKYGLLRNLGLEVRQDF